MTLPQFAPLPSYLCGLPEVHFAGANKSKIEITLGRELRAKRLWYCKQALIGAFATLIGSYCYIFKSKKIFSLYLLPMWVGTGCFVHGCLQLKKTQSLRKEPLLDLQHVFSCWRENILFNNRGFYYLINFDQGSSFMIREPYRQGFDLAGRQVAITGEQLARLFVIDTVGRRFVSVSQGAGLLPIAQDFHWAMYAWDGLENKENLDLQPWLSVFQSVNATQNFHLENTYPALVPS